MTIDRVRLSLHRKTLAALAVSLAVGSLLFWGWWIFALGAVERWYVPVYVTTEFWSLARDQKRPVAAFFVGEEIADQPMIDANLPGVEYRVEKLRPSRVHEDLRTRIYHGSLLCRMAWPGVVSLLVLLVALSWGMYLDGKRNRALRGDGWQIKGRRVLTPDTQGRRAAKGGLEIWTEN